MKHAEDDRTQTSRIAVADGRPLNNKMPRANDEDLEDTSVVINERLHDTRRVDVRKTSLVEYDCHLTTDHSTPHDTVPHVQMQGSGKTAINILR